MLPSSICSMGQIPRTSPHYYGMLPKQMSKGHPPMVTRAVGGVEKGEVGGNVRSLQVMHSKELQAKIRKQLQRVELSPSLYDTAWVAMVPERSSSQAPCYPQCIEWILQNQHDDGSWGINSSSLSVNKDILLSTLACVVALKKWNAGSYHIKRGLNFVGRNFSVAMDVQNIAPVGFNVTFSGLITLASGMGLQLPVWQTDIDEIFHLRKIELERDSGGTISARKAFMAYVAEGFGSLQDWDQVMAYQRKNGSLFNSPSTTAAAAIHTFNDRTLNYLDSLTNKFGGPVPAMYPQNIYSQLCTVDALERTGISQKFAREIRDILDTTYRSWLHNEEEVMLDIPTCAMAFRLLRTHGYDITSDEMAHFSEQSSFDDSIHGYLNDTKTLLELFKTSQIRFSCEDLVLENIGTWSAKLLKQQLLSNKLSTSAQSEVEYVLKFPLHSTLDRLEHRRNIEQFKVEGSKVLKSGYCGSHSNEEILALAVDYFHSSQSVYQQELKYFESWVKQCRLDELKFARVMPLIVHFSSAATIFAPELADARMVLSQTCMLITVYDDFFDCPEISREEKENYIALIEKWDNHAEIGFCSKNVEIVFYAVYNTYKQIGEKAALKQNRSIMDQLVEDLVSSAKAMMVEADWTATKYIPATMEEYMSNAEVSGAFASFVCPPLYFLGLKLSEEDVKSHEYTQLLKLTNVIGRLQNDSQTYRKEILAGKVNSVLLRALTDSGNTSPESIEAAKEIVNRDAESSMVEMRSLVFSEGGPIPRPCKDRFWEMCKIVFYFYSEDDAYRTPKETMSSARAVILDPLRLIPPPSCPETLSS
ncbi:ent-sandaracopimara-8(14),15-diene synthase, chloroplastic [Oryza sativa Japonica Group]|uniref:Ent-sandaracopimara-8(14),15-diene synthase, chloroplastic n=1 Tax=Oryza sativa subsp. japonica TaxID=39947 RepID=KSL10_ORYSJ|nr:ent-sandaracopimara-8(14),15-diene synthase, chloroplastic [Oryza sativa Japonica Group]Q2QQJ5.2 RecName: Full=Ent-sandaracopimara-8(14),15-diene synthase, chloroplastic; AltName: Full=Ent-kaurene synthase-like 10; Short=OsKSL10; AltName: Full=Ent-sandaracopimaradiene synthase; AltName: Full=Labdatriene synthase; Flags: Precursor [Oryza sativa Japonica Group]ABA98308.2 Terpene synthase family, metal binding domain containing protein, expressed [Oryza sativa Japonica Group]BAF29818.1 Os12g0491|eukprot:NP_001066799.1 Os12g0491800 [Oryza sativa Japonica Group]